MSEPTPEAMSNARTWLVQPQDGSRDDRETPRLAYLFDRFAAAAVERALHTPEIEDFMIGVLNEARHQRARWGESHDRSKSAENWYWLVGYLGGKALRAVIQGDREKALHHTVSAAAVLFQWHEAVKQDTSGSGAGEDADLRPAAHP